MEDEALEKGEDITLPEFQAVIEKLLNNRGFTLEEYEEFENPEPEDKPLKIEGVSQLKGDKPTKEELKELIIQLKDFLKGESGKIGNDGKVGEPGKPGKDGKKGKDGKDGKDGKIIFRGKEGVPGKQGVPGIDGKSVSKEEIEEVVKEGISVFERNINLAGMPDFRKLAMGLQQQIDGVRASVTTDTLTAQCDGSNKVFTTTKSITSLILAYLNGGLVLEGDGLTITGTKEITLDFAPTTGEVLIVKYL